MDGDTARRRLALTDEDFVVGVFGSTHHSRLLSYIRAAIEKIATIHRSVTVLYVGPNGLTMKRSMGDHIDIVDTGPLPANDVSRCFSAMDLYLAPFESGVSTRRGSFLAGIQHGVATVSTRGADTGQLLTSRSGESYILTPAENCDEFVDQCARLAQDLNLRTQIGSSGKAFYKAYFSWDRIAADALNYLRKEISSTKVTVSDLGHP
jgi:glycosyltransferase involved in cell wall biosynthesis